MGVLFLIVPLYSEYNEARNKQEPISLFKVFDFNTIGEKEGHILTPCVCAGLYVRGYIGCINDISSVVGVVNQLPPIN